MAKNTPHQETPEYSFEAYRKILTQFKEILDVVMLVSYQSGGIDTSRIGIICTQIYTRITISSMTIYSILPYNQLTRCALWDLASFANLARMLVETCHRYFYLADVNADKLRRDFRVKLYYYHLNWEKYRLFKSLDSAIEAHKEFEDKLQTSKTELINHAEYKKLNADRSYKVRSGKVDMHLTDAEIAESVNIMGHRYSAIYRILSAHTHGAPFATITQSNERGRGFENEVERIYYIGLLTIITRYLSKLASTQITILNLTNCANEKEVAERMLRHLLEGT